MHLRLTPRLLLFVALVATTPLLAQEEGGLILKIERVRACVQTNRDVAWPDAQSPYCFSALVLPVDPFMTVDSATIKPPGAPPMNLAPLPEYPGLFGFLDCGMVEQEIDGDYPQGAYEFVVEYSYLFFQDTFRTSIVLESNRYPNTPLFVGIDPRQSVSEASELPLSWTPFAGGVEGDDGMVIQIFHTTNFVTGESITNMPVSVTSPNPSFVIPANTLLPEQRYYALLTFDRLFASKFEVIDVGDLGIFDLYVLTQSAYAKTTRMPFNTAPHLTVISPPGQSPFRLSFPSIVGHGYQIQVSSNLVNWTTTRTTNAATTQVIYEELWQPARGPAFFRILIPPSP